MRGSMYSILSKSTETHNADFITNLDILIANLKVTNGIWPRCSKALVKLYPKMLSKPGFQDFLKGFIKPLTKPKGGIYRLQVYYTINND